MVYGFMIPPCSLIVGLSPRLLSPYHLILELLEPQKNRHVPLFDSPVIVDFTLGKSTPCCIKISDRFWLESESLKISRPTKWSGVYKVKNQEEWSVKKTYDRL
jgi:hypothetical protein